jgi:hypothetical protein
MAGELTRFELLGQCVSSPELHWPQYKPKWPATPLARRYEGLGAISSSIWNCIPRPTICQGPLSAAIIAEWRFTVESYLIYTQVQGTHSRNMSNGVCPEYMNGSWRYSWGICVNWMGMWIWNLYKDRSIVHIVFPLLVSTEKKSQIKYQISKPQQPNAKNKNSTKCVMNTRSNTSHAGIGSSCIGWVATFSLIRSTPIAADINWMLSRRDLATVEIA